VKSKSFNAKDAKNAKYAKKSEARRKTPHLRIEMWGTRLRVRKANADSSAALRNDNKKMQILRCAAE
jgi:hypothetical protein